MRRAPYGAWASPLGAAQVAAASLRFGDLVTTGEAAYWVETRPDEGGRGVLVRWAPGGEPEDVLPAPWSVRTRAHEYGGGALAAQGAVVCVVHDGDQRLYRVGPDRTPVALTPAGPWRWADASIDVARGRLVAVREALGERTTHVLAAVPLDGGAAPVPLVAGDDFYASPRLSPDGTQLAWLAWSHPRMPWDGTELWVAPLDAAGRLGPRARVAGGPRESVLQPEWSPEGALHFVSDRSGWWNLHRWQDGVAEPLCPLAAEFGVPQWVFGLHLYALAPDGAVYCAVGRDGTWQLGRVPAGGGPLRVLDAPFTEVSAVRVAGRTLVLRAGAPALAPAIVARDLAGDVARVLRRAGDDLDPARVSTPTAVRFPSAGGREVHALHYAPCNPDHAAPPGTRPPLLVRCHGGPTAAASSALDPALQFWTSRGFAVLDVNYGGSSGYGRAYRERLLGQWGVVDVEDCVAAARHAVAAGWADPARTAIRGSSAGGFTVLCALAFHDVFRAGVSWYGVGDLEALAHETHDFEAHYTDSLVAPWPEGRALYRARSPVHAAARIGVPVLFLQGLEDRVVPPAQAEAMVAALRARGRSCAYVPFAGEGHGFRRAATIRRALEAEWSFYAQVFGLPPPDVEAVTILPGLPGTAAASPR
ncbi:MAG: S9 family peptidase [bacterium]|nr:S9 family peptidase [bacterium]